jgi:hypothetical protein
MKLNAGLSLLNRGRITRQACRVCHENAELKTEGLCAVCAHLKARIHLHITRRPADGDSKIQAKQCTRSGCPCAPCGQRILDPHPFQPGAGGREIHFHPRCHALWLEVVRGSDASPRSENP